MVKSEDISKILDEIDQENLSNHNLHQEVQKLKRNIYLLDRDNRKLKRSIRNKNLEISKLKSELERYTKNKKQHYRNGFRNRR